MPQPLEENRSTGPERIFAARVISVAELCNGHLPTPDMDAGTKPAFLKIGKSQLHLFIVHNGINSRQHDLYVFVPPLSGLEVLSLFHFTSASKRFGLDVGDIKDWHALYEQPNNKERLDRHRTIPGWDIFEKDRECVLRAIDESVAGVNLLRLVPAVRIKNFSSTPTWEYSPLSPGLVSVLSKSPVFSTIQKHDIIFSLGPAFIGSYSPDVTGTWSQREGYAPEAHYHGTQDMGSTQGMVQSIRHSNSLLSGFFFKNLVDFAMTGKVPITPASTDETNGSD